MVIYKITNTSNGRVYIGSTVCFKRRKAGHLKDLNERKHHSYKLQADFNIYGELFFVFEIIETGFRTKRDLLFREYELIGRLKVDDYNIDRILPLNKIDPSIKEDRVKLGKTGTYIFVDKKSKPNFVYKKKKKTNSTAPKKKKYETKYVRPKETKKQRRIREGIIQIDGWDRKLQEYYKKKQLRDNPDTKNPT